MISEAQGFRGNGIGPIPDLDFLSEIDHDSRPFASPKYLATSYSTSQKHKDPVRRHRDQKPVNRSSGGEGDMKRQFHDELGKLKTSYTRDQNFLKSAAKKEAYGIQKEAYLEAEKNAVH